MPTKSASKIITRDPNWLGPAIPPGEMLLEEFLKPMAMRLQRLAGTVAVGNELSAPPSPGNTCENA